MLKTDEMGLLTADLMRPLNLFVGAGFSVLAKNSLKQRLPVGDELRQLMVSEFKLEKYDSLDLPSLYAILLADRKDALRSFLERVFTVQEFDSRYDALRRLAIEYLYTTNIDDLAFHIFSPRAGDERRAIHDNYTLGAPRHPETVIQYIALHGCVRHEDSDFLFTSGQMSTAFATDRETWYVFQRELQSRPTFFIGYSVRDAGVLQALHDSSAKNIQNRWIMLRKDDEAAKAVFETLGFHVIVGETDDFLAFLEQEIARTSPVATAPLWTQFTGRVPRANEVAQRPVRNFFLGAEPEWSDAYSLQVVRRRANSAVKNAIYSGFHVAVVGLPLSGKSTILRQVAGELSQERPTLFFDRLLPTQAEVILAEHQGSASRPLIFVDNLTDSRQSIEKLVKSINAQIVCAEDSLYFDSVSLRYMSGKLKVVSSSEIESQDLQRIISSIPMEVRRWNPNELDLIGEDSTEWGLFESLRRHVFDEELTARFKIKLAEFEHKDRVAFDVYIMACYVSACRTVTSFDMIYMFLDIKGKSYPDVYDIIKRIDSFLVEVELDDDNHQDYFSVRSGALAKIALRECSQSSFGRIFDRFHAAVPMRVIVDFPVFKRYAYDNDFTRKAYPRVEDGLRFYNRLVQTTDSAYDYQHAAIYLSKMKNFKEAFAWIDTALSKSRSRVFSIRNTHARVLFEANIDVLALDTSDKTALDGIRESMTVLEDCIHQDKSRTFHLLRFADQALQYDRVVNNSDSLKWLVIARDRLEQKVELAKVAGSRESYNLPKYRKIHSQVRAALAGRGVG